MHLCVLTCRAQSFPLFKSASDVAYCITIYCSELQNWKEKSNKKRCLLLQRYIAVHDTLAVPLLFCWPYMHVFCIKAQFTSLMTAVALILYCTQLVANGNPDRQNAAFETSPISLPASTLVIEWCLVVLCMQLSSSHLWPLNRDTYLHTMQLTVWLEIGRNVFWWIVAFGIFYYIWQLGWPCATSTGTM